ncbi:hypothetical protein JJQ59_07240 [Cupriavidus necator]|uniref:Uncharacterized protein n=1 Tax=Cupriavidus necator TaxID=106590 RepID=A0A367PBD7_CUPNE|nr:hypothetical protein [Cupriavidus necator]QQX85701.1 hypothetical protein JJQ59_07240 [Cupriavidus necator]RCJ05160.1 hypothetical protein DDK22_28185 [Cupriavidus necator]
MCALQQWSRQSSRHADGIRRIRRLRGALPPWLPSLLPALLLLYVFCHSHANWESCLASLRELNHDHGAPARELGRALSLARSLRGRQAPDPAAWHAAVQLAADRGSACLAALGRSPARLLPSLAALFAMLAWLH